MVQVLPHLLVEVALLLIRVLWNLHHLMVALPEQTGLPLAVAGVVFLTVRVLLAEVDPEVVAEVDPALEAEIAVAVHQASVGVDPETAVGFFVVADPVPGFEIAAVVSVAAVVALPVSVYFLPEFWQRLLPWQQVCPRQAA